MNLRTLKDTPPWDWPKGTEKTLLAILRDDRSLESDLLLATGLAGDFTAINDELVDALLSILRSGDRPERYAVGRRSPWAGARACGHGGFRGCRGPPDLGTHVPQDPGGAVHALHGRQRPHGRAAADPGGLGARPPGLAPGCDPRRLLERRRRLEAHRCLLHALRSWIRCADSRSARQREPRYPLRRGHCGRQLGGGRRLGARRRPRHLTENRQVPAAGRDRRRRQHPSPRRARAPR